MKLHNTLTRARGFTYFETLIVVGLITAITSFTIFIGFSSLQGYQYRAARQAVLSVLISARQDALSNINESKHGVRLEADKITLFTFPYVAGTSTNQIYPMEGTIRLTGIEFPVDVIFNQRSADTTPVNFSITNNNGKSGTISISAEGAISW